MDEPLSNLDAKLRVQMRTEISNLHQRLGATIIYVTHDQTEAMTLGTRIVVMKDGVVQQIDTPQNLYSHPVNKFVAGFIGSPQMNFVPALCGRKGERVVLNIGEYSIPLNEAKAKALTDGGYIGKEILMGIRPEDLYDIAERPNADPGTVIHAPIHLYELLGSEVYLYFNLEDSTMIARVSPATSARTGDRVDLVLDTDKIHLIDPDSELVICD